MTAAARTEKPVLVAGALRARKACGRPLPACADACPARALSFEGPALRITGARLRGMRRLCGCVSEGRARILSARMAGGVARDRIFGRGCMPLRKAAPGPGVPVPCIGGLSQTQRLELLQAGLRTLRMATGVCEGCPSEGRSARRRRLSHALCRGLWGDGGGLRAQGRSRAPDGARCGVDGRKAPFARHRREKVRGARPARAGRGSLARRCGGRASRDGGCGTQAQGSARALRFGAGDGRSCGLRRPARAGLR